MRPSPYGSLRTWTTRAVQRISWAEFPVTSAGIRRVASMGIPTCRGADDAKKNPPRETFRASVKCSVRSYAEGSEAQWRPKVKAAQLAAFSHFHCVLHRARKNLAQALANLVERCLQRNRASRAVKYQTFNGQSVPVPSLREHCPVHTLGHHRYRHAI